jgi:hypothetical protein
MVFACWMSVKRMAQFCESMDVCVSCRLYAAQKHRGPSLPVHRRMLVICTLQFSSWTWCFMDVVEISVEFLYFFHALGPNHECIICVLDQLAGFNRAVLVPVAQSASHRNWPWLEQLVIPSWHHPSNHIIFHCTVSNCDMVDNPRRSNWKIVVLIIQVLTKVPPS